MIANPCEDGSVLAASSGSSCSLAGLVRPILAACGQARLVDQFLTPRIAPYVTNANLLYFGVCGLILILLELRRMASADGAWPDRAALRVESDLDAVDLEVLRLLSARPTGLRAEEIAEPLAMSSEKALYHLEKLARSSNAHIHLPDPMTGNHWYGITPTGRDTLVKRKLLR